MRSDSLPVSCGLCLTIYRSPEEQVARVYAAGQRGPGLGVTRALGDAAAKCCGIIATPQACQEFSGEPRPYLMSGRCTIFASTRANRPPTKIHDVCWGDTSFREWHTPARARHEAKAVLASDGRDLDLCDPPQPLLIRSLRHLGGGGAKGLALSGAGWRPLADQGACEVASHLPAIAGRRSGGRHCQAAVSRV